ncbi:putative bifunctional diguanylate cyclase/phosphodiesterase [Enterovirga sp. CN4-39]|uniref:putative bifunctional diguanylate cyclase/phosphodiesterase n=1 Tax=Enterovirga sp. CN4-39 TaxID=3400910 RepID=UPI003C0213A0
MRAFKRRDESKSLDLADARRWEVRYVLGSSVYVFAMGVWCFLAFARTADPMVQLLCVSLVLVNVIGVMGRNFGSKLLVTAQLLCSGLPLLAALLWTGDLFYLLAAGVLTPFFFAFSTIADRLRQTLMGAVVAERDVRLLANRLDAALNNMSHGLCMVDRKGTIAISNNRLPHLLGVEPDVFRPGRPAIEAFLSCVRAGVVAPADLRRILAEIRSRLGEGAASLILPIRGRRTLMITSRSMPDGSSVMLAEDVTEQKKAEAQIRHLAHYDYLTDLPNRVKFRESVGRLLEEVTPESGCAVLFVDLDEFKQVNDTLGHPAGDVLLQLVATRLRTLAAESQLIARLGGDEFVIVIAPTARPEQAGAVAQRVVDELSRPFWVDGHAIIIGASVGIAIAPTDGTDADTLLKNADMALYRAKAEGRGRYRFFEPEMDTRMRERRALEIDLREAVAGAALELHYQPLVNLQTGRIAACEALLRWHHPERGLVSPGEFIPLAEEMGLIVEIGRWVLFSACREATHWPADTRVSVNLSPSQFRQPGLVETVGEALDRSGLDPARLDLEITESTLLRDTDGVLQTLEQIRALGVSISLDDFGTGYSSLSYLRKFPLQTVKIDRSFLLGIEANDKQRVLLRGIARLCGELGVRVVIEGVETSAQLDIISANPEIEEAQGFLFAKPASAAHTRRLLGFGFNSVTSASAAYGPPWSRRSAG